MISLPMALVLAKPGVGCGFLKTYLKKHRPTICCLNISKSSQMQFKVYPEEGKALTGYFPSWLNLIWRKTLNGEIFVY